MIEILKSKLGIRMATASSTERGTPCYPLSSTSLKVSGREVGITLRLGGVARAGSTELGACTAGQEVGP